MSTALYRRYRPESFADVIGQEHVTEPLMTALEKNRVNHAYLFSGPRGCGKTTSARILARCLNCAQGPTPTPCGVCESCKELSRDGGGSLDVIEMDAASHGGVDHARDLRERATFAPVRDRYKIFIIDEAHMVTREGFNALLKIVEEPPAHIKFIFATTEPNKVLGTIRSRTHHYPFRLVPPQILGNYLATLCAEEGVKVSEGVLPLVVRAGGGSVRDSLSILDQLMAGASDEHGISYDLAVALLGFTHGELLDEVVDAFASGSAAEVFASVDKVIQTGQDPRRFVEDLLERLRDLIIVKAVPNSAGSILRGLAADQLERMRAQAEKLGGAELSRAADLTNEALNEMSGAMNPQLHLELLCARILLAAGEQGIGSLTARLDRLERKLASVQFPAQGASQQGASQQGVSQQGAQAVSAQKGADAARPLARAQQQSAQTGTTPTGAPLAGAPLAGPPLGAAGSAPMAGAPLATAPLASAPLAKTGQQAPQAQQTPQVSQGQQRPHASETSQVPQHSTQQSVPGENTVDMVANSWADVVARVPSAFARAQFALCEPSKFEKGALFLRAELPVLKAVKEYLPQLQQALAQVLGLQVQLRGEIKKPGDGGGPNGGGRPNGDNPGGGSPGGGSPHPTGSNSAPEGGNSNPANSQSPNRQPANRQPVNSQPAAPQPAAPQPAAPHQPDVAEGPRGGEQAWAAHGQPRSPEPPSWSPNDWNNPVTSWSVAAIPSGDTPETPEATGAGHPAETPPAQPTEQGSAIPAGNEQEANQQAPDQQEANRQEPSEQIPRDQAPSEQPSPPHLRVIDGEADPVEMAKAQHPSNGSQEQHNIALAREVTPPSDTEQAEEEVAHEDSPHAVSLEPVPTSEGLAEQGHKDADNAALQEEAQSDRTKPQGPVAYEYGDYDGGYFDDASVDEPEYVAGVGYLKPETPPVAPLSGAPLAQAPQAHVTQPQAAQTQAVQAQAAQAQAAQAQAAQAPTAQPQASAQQASAPQSKPAGGQPGGKKLSFRERHAAQIAAGQRSVQQAQAPAPAEAPEDFTPSDDDAALESSVLIGQRAVEKILGGKVIDEQPLHQG